MKQVSQKKRSLFFLFFFIPFLCLTQALAVDKEIEEKLAKLPPGERALLLAMYDPEEIFISETRAPKLEKHVAHNHAIVTRKDIERIGAHTLADVLRYVPGVVVEFWGGPGSTVPVSILGSDYRHVQLVVDGIPFNTLASNYPDIAAIPAEIIEKVEIIKGPSSSAWGSALGGVINVITKKAGEKKGARGLISFSQGEKNTGDSRVALDLKKDGTGAYLYGGSLYSDGLIFQNKVHMDSLYGRISHEVSKNLSLDLSAGFLGGGGREQFGIREFDMFFKDEMDYGFSRLNIISNPVKDSELSFSFWGLKLDGSLKTKFISTSETLQKNSEEDKSLGASARFNLLRGRHNMVLGGDLTHQDLEIDRNDADRDKYSIFVNDTIDLGRFVITPGIRYDYTDTEEDFLSPYLGLVFEAHEKVNLKASISRGFNLPDLGFYLSSQNPFFVPNKDLELEKTWSYQAGFDAGPFLYTKTSLILFYHRLSDTITTETFPDGTFTFINAGKSRYMGVDLSTQTDPIYNTSLLFSLALVDAEDRETDEPIPGVATFSMGLGARYERDGLLASIMGRYVNFRTLEGSTKKGGIIWDIHFAKRLLKKENRELELFGDLHNAFNGTQYLIKERETPGRWVEMGLKLRF